MAPNISLTLNKDEAIVLFEWLARFNEGSKESDFEDQAEQRTLWNLEATLESALAEPFSADYDKIVEAARDRLRDEGYQCPGYGS